MTYRLFILFFAALFLVSCQQRILVVQTRYISKEDRASFRVGTPDPYLNCPPVGQRMIVSWKLHQKVQCYDPLKLQIRLRLANRQEVEQCIPIHDRTGTWVYTLLNSEFCNSGGIATYKISMLSGDTVLDVWQHQLWVELITFPEEQEEEWDIEDWDTKEEQ